MMSRAMATSRAVNSRLQLRVIASTRLFSDSQCSAMTSSSSVGAVAAAACAPVTNASRARMKREMQELRETVAELERQLEERLRRRTQRTVMQEPNKFRALKVHAAWERLSRGQYEQRHRSQLENYKLRRMLDEHRRVSETLGRLFSKQMSTESIPGCPVSKKRARHGPESTSSCPMDDRSVIQELRAGLPALYEQADTVLSGDAFSSRPHAFRDIDLRHSGSVDMHLEAREKRLLPFSLQNTSDAVWTYFLNHGGSRRDDDGTNIITPCNILERSFTMDMKLERFAGHVRVKVAVRRYVESNRAVFVWVALIDPSDVLPPHINGLVVKQTGWIATRPLSSKAVLTELLTANLTVPEYYDAVSLRKRRSSTVSNYLIGSVTSQLDLANEIVDNLLMEWALKKREG